MRDPTIIFVVARSRTGSTSLEHFLGEGSGCLNLGEVFHQDKQPEERNFYQFLAACCREDSKMAHPTSFNQVFRNFTQGIADRAQASSLVVDLKLYYWDVLPSLKQDGLRLPHLLVWREFPCRLVYLRRRNALARILSEDAAWATGWWGINREYEDDTDARSRHGLKNKLRYEPDELVARIKEELAEDNALADRFSRDDRAVVVEYEDLYTPDSGFATVELARLARSLGLNRDLTGVRPLQVKQNLASHAEMIENPAAVRAALGAAGLAYMWTGRFPAPRLQARVKASLKRLVSRSR